jgi:hypothetical protein
VTSTIDFTNPPNIFVTYEMLAQTFAGKSYSAPVPGAGQATAMGWPLLVDFVIMGGTGILALYDGGGQPDVYRVAHYGSRTLGSGPAYHSSRGHWLAVKAGLLPVLASLAKLS